MDTIVITYDPGLIWLSDDDELEPESESEWLTVAAGIVCWHAEPDYDD